MTMNPYWDEVKDEAGKVICWNLHVERDIDYGPGFYIGTIARICPAMRGTEWKIFSFSNNSIWKRRFKLEDLDKAKEAVCKQFHIEILATDQEVADMRQRHECISNTYRSNGCPP